MYKSLHELIQPHIEGPYDNLPEDVRVRVTREFPPQSWSSLTPTERSLRAKELDAQWEQSPLAFWFRLQDQILSTERQIAEQSALHPEGSENAESAIGKLKKDLAALCDEWRNLEAQTGVGQQHQVLKIHDALRFLAENTGVAWTEADLLSLASRSGIGLYAAVSPWTPMHVVNYDPHGFSSRPYVKPGRSVFADLPQELVEQIWVAGQAEATWVASDAFSVGDEQVYFTEPVTVKRSDLRLTNEKLLKILNAWNSSNRSIISTIPSSLPLSGQSIDSAISTKVRASSEASSSSSCLPTANSRLPEPPTWVTKAREIAKEYIDRHKANNLFPSQANVCAHVESELRSIGVCGPHGRPVSAAYVGRNALQGDWWKANRP